jgi:hypothetical protein
MVALTERYSSDEFAVLAFPCNQFGGQEPGTPDEILAFAGKYGATFPMFEKVDVNGPNTCVKWHSNSRALRSPSLSRLEEKGSFALLRDARSNPIPAGTRSSSTSSRRRARRALAASLATTSSGTLCVTKISAFPTLAHCRTARSQLRILSAANFVSRATGQVPRGSGRRGALALCADHLPRGH